MKRVARRSILGSMLVFTVAIAFESVAVAERLDPGFDFFATPPFHSDLLGIDLKGRPIVPNTTTDTIMARLDPLPAGGTGQIEIELVALSLQSVSPVEMPGLGMVEAFVTVNVLGIPGLPQPDDLTPSTGMITILSHVDGSGGGTFSSTLDVFADLILTSPGGDPNDPAQILAHRPLDVLHLENPSAAWSHTPPPAYPVNPDLPSGGFFVTAAGIPHQGLHPVGPSQRVPEPRTLGWLGSALAAWGVVAAWRRFRR